MNKLKHKQISTNNEIEIINVDYDTGLTSAQADERFEAGLSNTAVSSVSKTIPQIIFSNVFTYFNLVFFVIAACLTMVGSYKHLTFLFVILANLIIGIVQEVSAKRTLDKLNILAAPHANVVRDGKIIELPCEKLVRDDIVLFSAGNQICADGKIIYGEASFNESLITGESDEMTKSIGDTATSGSFVVSGKCWVQLEKVGADSFVSRLTLSAKKQRKKKPKGMMKSLDILVKSIGVALIPLSAMMFYKETAILGQGITAAVESTAAALLGMIPEGLYLLTSVALAVSVMRIASKKALAHDLGCIETLARVDVLCVDKTGTITDDKMRVMGIIPIDSSNTELLRELMCDISGNMPDDNATMYAIKEYCGERSYRKAQKVIPFSSSVKYSGVIFSSDETYVLGAPEFVLRSDFEKHREIIEKYTADGSRVLLLAKYHGQPDGKPLCMPVTPIGIVTLVNNIRPEAPETFKYFTSQGVEIKVISGDNPITASYAASAAGIPNAERYIDISHIGSDEKLAEAAEKYTVFGRVTPEQKRTLVRALKKAGHTVAMTGDGVNDVLALKEADCSIAMASGSEVAGQVAHLVLLDSKFSSMPSIVAEGRRVINNIERSASLFLVKNIFSFFMSLISIFAVFSYPILPAQLSLVSIFTIGIPSFFLALQPNTALVKGKFLRNILYRALPAGITDIIIIIGAVLYENTFMINGEQMSTVCTLLLGVVGLTMLYRVCSPFNFIRASIWCGMLVLFTAAAFWFDWFFTLVPLEAAAVLIFVTFALFAILLSGAMRRLIDRLIKISEYLKKIVKKIIQKIKV